MEIIFKDEQLICRFSTVTNYFDIDKGKVIATIHLTLRLNVK